LSVAMTPALELRGKQRELLRHVNDLRKLARLTPGDIITLYVSAGKTVMDLISGYTEELKSTAGVFEIDFSIPDTVEVKKVAKISDEQITLGLTVRS